MDTLADYEPLEYYTDTLRETVKQNAADYFDALVKQAAKEGGLRGKRANLALDTGKMFRFCSWRRVNGRVLAKRVNVSFGMGGMFRFSCGGGFFAARLDKCGFVVYDYITGRGASRRGSAFHLIAGGRSMKKIKIFSKMGEEVERLERCGADLIHCDVMDGTFVPTITFGMHMIEAVRRHTSLPLDVHIMCVRPLNKVSDIVNAGADIVTVHAEACGDALKDTLRFIRSYGIRAGVAISPDTPFAAVAEYAELFDMLLVMSVYPGRGGQKLIERTLAKAEEARNFFEKTGLVRDIEMDGGITEENVASVKAAGVNVIVAGSTVFHAPDMAKTIQNLRDIR